MFTHVFTRVSTCVRARERARDSLRLAQAQCNSLAVEPGNLPSAQAGSGLPSE